MTGSVRRVRRIAIVWSSQAEQAGQDARCTATSRGSRPGSSPSSIADNAARQSSSVADREPMNAG